ncbi:MAG TPA: radical SAM protein [Mariprofundaceae bacterium]|nr:radical SAM protein [Mariprofundaceae bacterium]
MTDTLSIHDHDRNAAGMTYVYPVISRRAGGVSVGINLNPNNACNWHCAYCQVPNLVRGVAPEIDLAQLRVELHAMLAGIVSGDFMQRRVPEGCRTLCDVAISGNGEPTSCRDFDAVVGIIVDEMLAAGLGPEVKLRLITNGSYIHKPEVRAGLLRMAQHNGEVWIKVDSATQEGIRRINGIATDAAHLRRQVESVATLCPTWIQTCMLAWDGEPPADNELQAYLEFMAGLKAGGVPVQGILLYGLARESMQAEAVHVSPLSGDWLEEFAGRLRAAGWQVAVSL